MRETSIKKTPEQALTALMRYCSRAERSTGDALRLMRNWGVEESEQAQITARLVELRFIDDERFTAAYIRDKTEFAGWGVHKIAMGLRAKGIAKDTIRQALSKLNRDDTRERLQGLLERKLRTIKGGTQYEIRTKLFRYAMGRGYEYDDVMSIINETVD